MTLSHEMPDDLIRRLRPDARTAVVAVKNGVQLNAPVPVAAGKSRLEQAGQPAFTAPACAV